MITKLSYLFKDELKEFDEETFLLNIYVAIINKESSCNGHKNNKKKCIQEGNRLENKQTRKQTNKQTKKEEMTQ